MTLFTAVYCLSLGFVLGLSVMLKIARNAWLLSTNHRVTRLEKAAQAYLRDWDNIDKWTELKAALDATKGEGK
jgi:hypothetical protein